MQIFKAHSRKGILALFMLSFMLGAVSALAMAPLNFWPALFVTLSLLYLLIYNAQTIRGAALYGWGFGFGYFLCGLYWVGHALLVDGNPYIWAWPLAVSGLPALLAFFPMFACALIKASTNMACISGFFAFVGWLSLFEWVRGHIFTGFPWNLFAYSWADIESIIQITYLSDVYVLTALTIFWAATPALLYISDASPKQKSLLIFLTTHSFAACFLYGFIRLQTADLKTHENLSVQIVQANVPQQEKWQRDKMAGHFADHIRLSQPQDESTETTLIIWPETAITQSMLEDAYYKDQITTF